jgi:hypothetical protein
MAARPWAAMFPTRNIWKALLFQKGQPFLKKEPAIGDGSQSREKRQGKSIRGNVVCRNSHTEGKLSPVERNRAARHEARRPDLASYRLNRLE